MTRHRQGTLLLWAVLALVAGSGGTLQAQDTIRWQATHYADLRGEYETDAVETWARGIAIVRLNQAQMRLRYRLSVAGLTNITAAHFHIAPAGQSGPPVFTIPGITDSMMTVTGTWQMDATQLQALLAGNVYINVHTSDHPGGEIRGQVVPVPNGVIPEMGARFEQGHTVNDTNGTGGGFAMLDETSKTIVYSVNWQDLSGPPQAAHFHYGNPFVSGPVVHPLMVNGEGSGAAGVWQNVPDSVIQAYREGNLYVNVHTAANPMGEIRGQLLPTAFFTAAIEPEFSNPSHADSSNGAGTGFVALIATPFGAAVGGEAVVSNTSAPVGAAHLHKGGPTENGPVLIGMLYDQQTSTWMIPTVPTIIALPDTLQSIVTGQAYLNFHTSTFPNGEVRGQLIASANNLSAGPSSVPVRRSIDGGVRWELRGETISVASDRAAGTVLLIDPLGREVLRGPLEGRRRTFDVGGLAAGAYTLRLLDGADVIGQSRVVIVR